MKHTFASISRAFLFAALLTVALLSASTPATAAAKAPVWEVVEAVDVDAVPVLSTDEASASGFEVSVHEGRIYITVDKPVKIEVFSILGQLVASRTIAPGTVRLTIGNRGIYILKGAGSTRRINL
ncbi:MAG: T9SS type A sorting domain-containing protein [Muribaculaceae bacterium]|nr:T9SS type A sorting domain-containing protein [Muribaculaceae bacterium]